MDREELGQRGSWTRREGGEKRRLKGSAARCEGI